MQMGPEDVSLRNCACINLPSHLTQKTRRICAHKVYLSSKSSLGINVQNLRIQKLKSIAKSIFTEF